MAQDIGQVICKFIEMVKISVKRFPEMYQNIAEVSKIASKVKI